MERSSCNSNPYSNAHSNTNPYSYTYSNPNTHSYGNAFINTCTCRCSTNNGCKKDNHYLR
jgi:hypothetical protein